jgi:hypothetical protein
MRAMAKSKIDQLDWDAIVDSIRAGRCVPFLGAGVNVSADGYDGLPLGGAVARDLLRRLAGNTDDDEELELVWVKSAQLIKDNYPHLLRAGAHDLARVSLPIQVTNGNARLVDILASLLPEGDRQPSPLLDLLACLPVRLIVTTNYDCLMERALVARLRTLLGLADGVAPPDTMQPIVVVQPTSGFTSKQQAENKRVLSTALPASYRAREPTEPAVVYKIHGSFSDRSRGLIVSEQDYIDFLAVVGGQSRGGVPRQIAGAIQDSLLLFLGYGLEDWDFRTIYKILVEALPKVDERMSFAIQRDPSPFWEELWREKKVRIYDVDLYEFAAELGKRMATG